MLLRPLAAPWPEGSAHGEVTLELKLAGNHLDRKAVECALLRWQARQVQRLEEQDPAWLGEEPLWLEREPRRAGRAGTRCTLKLTYRYCVVRFLVKRGSRSAR